MDENKTIFDTVTLDTEEIRAKAEAEPVPQTASWRYSARATASFPRTAESSTKSPRSATL